MRRGMREERREKREERSGKREPLAVGDGNLTIMIGVN